MDLAVMMGRLDVDRMLREISSHQWHEWVAYMTSELRGDKRADYRTAHIVSTIFNMAVEPKDRKGLDQFLMDFETKDETKVKGVKPVPGWMKRRNEMLALAQEMASREAKKPPNE